jgi:hypothetical protein
MCAESEVRGADRSVRGLESGQRLARLLDRRGVIAGAAAGGLRGRGELVVSGRLRSIANREKLRAAERRNFF